MSDGITHCLKTSIFLWKANNYKCYKQSVEEHDRKVWLCKCCASPRKMGEGLFCPLHYGTGHSKLTDDYDEDDKFILQPRLV